jgi:hypothetical protein
MHPFNGDSESPSRISNQVDPLAKYKPDTLPIELINSVTEAELCLSLSIAVASHIQ